MWKVLPKFLLFKAIFFVFFIVVIFTLSINKFDASANGSFAYAIELSSIIILGFLVFVWILAKWLWKPLWTIPKLDNILNHKVCPDLNGEWSGVIISNFPGQGSQSNTKVKMKIEADFLGFSLFLNSEDGYSKSSVVQSEIYKDPKTGIYYLSYIFEAEVHLPKKNDDRLFDGAARLEVIYLEDQQLKLKGTYWTNRAWQRNLNTAGIIELTRNT